MLFNFEDFYFFLNSIPKFSGDVSQLPHLCRILRNIQRFCGENLETMILDEIPVFLVGRAYRVFGKTRLKYKSLEIFLKDLCSYFWDIRELQISNECSKDLTNHLKNMV